MSYIATGSERSDQRGQEVGSEKRLPFFDIEHVGTDAKLAAGIISVIKDLSRANSNRGFSKSLRVDGVVRRDTVNPERASHTASDSARALTSGARIRFAELGGYAAIIDAGGDPEEVLEVSDWRTLRETYIGERNRRTRETYIATLQSIVDAGGVDLLQSSQGTAA